MEVNVVTMNVVASRSSPMETISLSPHNDPFPRASKILRSTGSFLPPHQPSISKDEEFDHFENDDSSYEYPHSEEVANSSVKLDVSHEILLRKDSENRVRNKAATLEQDGDETIEAYLDSEDDEYSYSDGEYDSGYKSPEKLAAETVYYGTRSGGGTVFLESYGKLFDDSKTLQEMHSLGPSSTCVECVGCCFSESVGNLLKRVKDGGCPMEPFHGFCQTPAFMIFVTNFGMKGVTFTANPHSFQGRDRANQFVEACQKMDTSFNISIVFHGTGPSNVEGILQNGLDPKKRRSQAYGPGEYFSKNPVISLGYCQSGTRMLVCCVVVPKADMDEETRLPPDYVVVAINENQIPIGYIDWETTDFETGQKAQTMRQDLKKLSKDLAKHVKEVDEATLKATIIQCLIQSKFDIAIDKYEKNKNSLLSETSKREISSWVHMTMDSDVIPGLFGCDFPEPYSKDEFESNTVSVEVQVEKARAAKRKFEEAV